MIRARAPEIAPDIEERLASVPLTLGVLCPVHRVNARLRILVPLEAGAVAVTDCNLFAEGAAVTCGTPCVHMYNTAPGESPEMRQR
jgi:hypothetical protein